MSSVIRLRRGTSAQWASSTIIMAVAELGLDTTLNKLKAGNGVHTWNNLPYINVLPSELSELSQDAVNTAIVAGLHISKTYDDTANTITIASTLTNVDNTSDANKPVSTATQTELNLKAPIASPTFTGTVVLPTYTSIGQITANEIGTLYGVTSSIQGQIDLKSTIESPTFTGIPSAPTASSSTNTTQIATTQFVKTAVANLVNSAPEALDTLKELSDALGADANYATTISTALGLKAPLENPTFTGTVSGVSKGMVGLGNVDNTSDTEKPLSSLASAAINSINQALETKSNNLISSIVTTSTSYTVGISDLYNRIEFDSTSPITVTIPADLTANLPIGSSIELLQSNTGKITVQGESVAVSIYGPDNQFKSRVQWSSIFLEKRGANSWLITGDTES